MENYIEVQEWFDGTIMTPGKADGVIYILENSLYYKRIICNSTVNPLWWGIKDNGDPDFDTNGISLNWQRIKKMFDICVLQSLNIHFPKGEFSCGNYNFPFNHNPQTTDLKDFKNIIISGEGRGTVLRTDSQTGADVILLHMVANLTLKDFAVTATVAKKEPQNGAIAGSNGVSLINGYDNITLENIHVFDLEGVEYARSFDSEGFEHAGYIDGAKGFTIQNDNKDQPKTGKLKIINCSSKNNAYGWRHDGELKSFFENNIDIDIDLSIEKSWIGFSVSLDEADKNFDEYKRINYRGKITLIDCQQDIILNRLYGGNLEFHVQSDKNQTQLKTNPLTGDLWKNSTNSDNPFDEIIMTAYLAYVKHSHIKIYGYKKINHFKYAMGSIGTIIEPFTDGRTEYSNFLLKVAGDTIEQNQLKIIPNENASEYTDIVFKSTIDIDNFDGHISPKILNEQNGNLVISNKKLILNEIGFGDYASASLGYGGIKFKQTLGYHGNLKVIEALSNTDESLFSVNNMGEVILKNDRKIVTGESLPNGNITANQGSMYLRTVGGDSYTLWIKTSGNNEFGWKLVPIVENYTTSNRPNLTLSEDIGKMIFDTDLGCHVTWTGTKWIKYNFTDA